jgi:hypothetical protein
MPQRVWAVLCDVERWPEWTASMKSVRRLESGPLAVGSRARVVQPRLLPAVWQVTEFDRNRSFTWVSRSPGMCVAGGHRVEARRSGSLVTLTMQFSGWLGPLLARLMRGISERYMSMEAAGLKQRSEADTPAL